MSYIANKKENRFCKHCKDGVLSYKQTTFCSRVCQNLYVKRDAITCNNCEKSFYPKSANNKGFCSNQCWIDFKTKNKIANRQGVCQSAETREKMSLSKREWFRTNSVWNKGLKGYKAGQEHHNWGKTLFNMQGSNNPNWRGGTSLDNKNNRMSADTAHWRRAVFNRDNHTCQICHVTGGYLHADHIKSWSKYPELRYDLNNGRTLCQACHYKVTYGKDMPENTAWGINYKKIRGVTSF